MRLHYSPAPPTVSRLIDTSYGSMVGPSTPPICRSVRWTPAFFLSYRNSSWTFLGEPACSQHNHHLGEGKTPNGPIQSTSGITALSRYSPSCTGLRGHFLPTGKTVTPTPSQYGTHRDKTHEYLDWMFE